VFHRNCMRLSLCVPITSLIPLRGLVVNESNNALRFRLDGGWEVDIYKEMILRVEADNYEAFQLRNWEASNKAPVAAL
jgi:hypothetical protein